MSIRVSAVIAVFGLLLLVNGCNRNSDSAMTTAPTPVTGNAATSPPAMPSATGTAGATGAAVNSAQKRSEITVHMHDNCDPETFNLRLGPGTCVGPGGLRFDNFIAELTRNGFVGSWHFAPRTVNAVVGQMFVAVNEGGEEHTFTEVKQFGGGIIPLLNQLSGNPVETPECQALEEDDHVQPGGRYEEDIDEAGMVKVQCCIHPWMRLEARVSSK